MFEALLRQKPVCGASAPALLISGVGQAAVGISHHHSYAAVPREPIRLPDFAIEHCTSLIRIAAS
jgi:hypothetical protein